MSAGAASSPPPYRTPEKFLLEKAGRDLDRLRNGIKDWVENGSDPNLRDLLHWQFDSEAKYFRPLTVFCCHYAVSSARVPASLVTSAQVVEMFHNVTLIIDDIVDRSKTRRGKAALWKRCADEGLEFRGERAPRRQGRPPSEESAQLDARRDEGGKLTAYMVAGYVLADCYDMLAKQEPDGCEAAAFGGRHAAGASADAANPEPAPDSGAPDAQCSELDRTGLIDAIGREHLDRLGPIRYDLRLLSELVKRLGVAECVQWHYRKIPLGVPDWRYLAREDTGSMFEVCACIGARSQRLRRFGRLLGMLYHGCDDVADLRAAKRSEELRAADRATDVPAAKGLAGGGDDDLIDGILTLPAALALSGDESLKELFAKGQHTDAEREELLQKFATKLAAAEVELDRIAQAAIQEARDANVYAPEYLIALVQYTRTLSGR